MGGRSVEPENGVCDCCGQSTTVYDLMGDVLCTACLLRRQSEPENVDLGILIGGCMDEVLLTREGKKTRYRIDDRGQIIDVQGERTGYYLSGPSLTQVFGPDHKPTGFSFTGTQSTLHGPSDKPPWVK